MSVATRGCCRPVIANIATARVITISTINAVDADIRHLIINASSIYNIMKIYETLVAVII